MSRKIEHVGFIGAGNMAQCIIAGITEAGLLPAEHIWASAPSDRNLRLLKEQGINVTNQNVEVAKKCSVIFICVKPHFVDVVAAEIKNHITPFHLVISIAAAVKTSRLATVLPTRCKIVRCMPNTAMTVKAGTCALCRGPGTDAEDVEFVKRLLGNLGLCEEVPENLMDAVGGLSGCGPAYVFLVIQGMADGAVKMGVPRQLALKFAAQTVMGAGKLALESKLHPEELKDNVCSPGGTTIYGVHCLENRSTRGAFAEAVEAATRRAQELSHRLEGKSN
ncbi:unnamed protein product [Ixodes hexagonus]